MLKKQSAFATPVPPVSKRRMRAAANRYHEMDGPGSYEKMTEACASFTLGPLTSLDKPRSGSRRFMALAQRFTALHTVLEQHKAKILEREEFPATWLDIAAVAPLTITSGFDRSLFLWPIESTAAATAVGIGQ
jgi:hypothetical protein